MPTNTKLNDALRIVTKRFNDMTVRQLAALIEINNSDGPSTVRGIAETLGVGRPVITRAADKLEELGLVVRRPDPEDRRSIQLWPTGDGRKLAKQLH